MVGSVGPSFIGKRLEILFGLDLVQEITEKIRIIKERIRHSRADKNHMQTSIAGL